MPSHENASINLWPGARERLMEGITKSHHGHECSARPKNILIIVAPTHLTTLAALNYQNKNAGYRHKKLPGRSLASIPSSVFIERGLVPDGSDGNLLLATG